MGLQKRSDEAEAFLAALQDIVGARNLLTLPEDQRAYLADWTGASQAEAMAVVRPANTQEVAKVVRLCAAQGIAVVPQGGRTGLCGGGVPMAGPGVVLSLARLTAIRQLDPEARDQAGLGSAKYHEPRKIGSGRVTGHSCAGMGGRQWDIKR